MRRVAEPIVFNVSRVREALYWNRPVWRTELRSMQEDPVLHVAATAPKPIWGGTQTSIAIRRRLGRRRAPFTLAWPTAKGWIVDQSRPGGSRRWRPQLSPRTGSPRITDLEPVLEAMRCRLVHLESLAGFDPGIASGLTTQRSLVVSLHDHSWFCRRPHLFHAADSRFCDFNLDPNVCRRCLRAAGEPEHDLQSHRAEARSLLSRADRIIVPSRYLRTAIVGHLGDGSPDTEGLADKFEVIPPAGWPATVAIPSHPPKEKPRIAFLGGDRLDKGFGEFQQLVTHDHDSAKASALWFVFGASTGSLNPRRDGEVRVRGPWKPGRLSARLIADRIDLVIFPGTQRETYSLVLSEVLDARLPVLARAVGAHVERLQDRPGALFPAEADTADVYRRILAQEWKQQRGLDSRRSTPASEVVDAHERIYRRLLSNPQPPD